MVVYRAGCRTLLSVFCLKALELCTVRGRTEKRHVDMRGAWRTMGLSKQGYKYFSYDYE